MANLNRFITPAGEFIVPQSKSGAWMGNRGALRIVDGKITGNSVSARRSRRSLMNRLETLKREKLVLDWRKQEMTRAAVRQTIEIKLDELPSVYEKGLYEATHDLPACI